MENPGYPIVREVFKQNGFEIEAIGIEKDGLNISQLENSSSHIVYTTPSHQFPCGAVYVNSKKISATKLGEKKMMELLLKTTMIANYDITPNRFLQLPVLNRVQMLYIWEPYQRFFLQVCE